MLTETAGGMLIAEVYNLKTDCALSFGGQSASVIESIYYFNGHPFSAVHWNWKYPPVYRLEPYLSMNDA